MLVIYNMGKPTVVLVTVCSSIIATADIFSMLQPLSQHQYQDTSSNVYCMRLSIYVQLQQCMPESADVI